MITSTREHTIPLGFQVTNTLQRMEMLCFIPKSCVLVPSLPKVTLYLSVSHFLSFSVHPSFVL